MAKLNSLSDLKHLFPEAEGTFIPESKPTDKSGLQQLEAHFSNKGRGGKTVTVIKGFQGSDDQCKALAKKLKQFCGVGGSVKNHEIIIQGNVRDKVMEFLRIEGHHVKRVGG